MAQLKPLVLASASPRRREILAQLGLEFSVRPSDVPEPELTSGSPEAYARGLAEQKCGAVVDCLRERVSCVLAADTIVVVNGRVLNKPEDDGDACRMLGLLQGRGHEVITAVALRASDGSFRRTLAVRSRVMFRALDAETIARYVASREGRDKAGSYAVQGLGAGLVRAIDGSYSNVVGLPACETLKLLVEAGVLGAWP